MDGNVVGLVWSYSYFFALILLAEAMRRRAGWEAASARKLVRLGVGMWSIPTLGLFSSWKWGIVPPLTWAFLGWASYRYEISKALADWEQADLGAGLFPLSFALLLGLCWRPGTPEDTGYIAVAGLLAMTWGKWTASLVGRRWGTRRYRSFGHHRSMEGTLAMFFAASAAMTPVLALLGGMDWHPALALAMIGATVAAGVESVSPYGSDGFTVPLATAFTLCLLVEIS